MFLQERGLEFSTPGVCLRLIFLFIVALGTNPDERAGQIPMEWSLAHFDYENFPRAKAVGHWCSFVENSRSSSWEICKMTQNYQVPLVILVATKCTFYQQKKKKRETFPGEFPSIFKLRAKLVHRNVLL